MRAIKLSDSLPQSAYSARQVLENEAIVAKSMAISMTRLMEKAGLAVFNHMHQAFSRCTNLLVVCGKGNNGGDGFITARLAEESGIQVTVYLCCEAEQLKGDAKLAFEQLLNTTVTIIYHCELVLTSEFLQDNQFQLIIDAIFGIGFRGQLPEEISQLVAVINHSAIPVLSVDVPSGLNATTGDVEKNAVVAEQTVTFIAIKQGLLTGQAASYCGELHVAGLGLGQAFQDKVTANVFIQSQQSTGQARLPELPVRSAASHKGTIGQLLTLGGGQGMPGAIRLASEAALRSGASLVAVACHPKNIAMVANGRPELMLTPVNAKPLTKQKSFTKAKWLLCGPGLGLDAWAQQLFQQVLQADKPCLLDADALTILALHPEYRDNWILTPHPGEAARLLNCTVSDIERDRFSAVRQICKKYGGICLLKGAGSLICDGENIWINTSGNSGMASGGMGDVLSGIIAALAMQMPSAVDALRLAVFIHGIAADIVARESGKIGMLASDLFPVIQGLLNKESLAHYELTP